MSKTKMAIDELRAQGHDDQSILDALCDGAALASMSLGDEDQDDIEDAADDIRKAIASKAAAALGRKGGKVKSEAKSAAAKARNAKRKEEGKPQGGRPRKVQE